MVLAGGCEAVVSHPATVLQPFDGRSPGLIAPASRRLQHFGGHQAGRPVNDQRLDALHALDRQRRDVTIAAILAQQRDREPQRQVRLGGPLLGEVSSEQRTTLRRAGVDDRAQHVGGFCDVGLQEAFAEDSNQCGIGSGKACLPQCRRRRTLPCLWHQRTNSIGLEVVERGHHDLGGHCAHGCSARREVAHHSRIEAQRRVLLVGFGHEVNQAVEWLEPLPQET